MLLQDGSEYEIIPQVKQTQEVEIYDPIEVHPPLLFFPWDPVKESNHRYKLKVVLVKKCNLFRLAGVLFKFASRILN